MPGLINMDLTKCNFTVAENRYIILGSLVQEMDMLQRFIMAYMGMELKYTWCIAKHM